MSMTVSAPEVPTEVAPQNIGLMARMSLAVLGAALSFSAFAIWLMPGANGAPEVSLMKLGVSVFMLIGGMSCLIASRPAAKSRHSDNPD